jgi:hypothetical protein
MLRRFMKKRVLVALTAVGVLALAAGAYAYFVDTGSTTNTASVGSSTGWTVKDNTAAATLYPGQGSESITGTVTNGGSANQQLNTVTVTINAPSNTSTTYSAASTGHACAANDFALSSSSGSGWTVAAGGLSATYSPATDLTPSSSFTYGGTAHSLTLSMVDGAYNQNNCQGATANYTVAAG